MTDPTLGLSEDRLRSLEEMARDRRYSDTFLGIAFRAALAEEEPTVMRDCDEPCPDCGHDKTAELVPGDERVHLYCGNTDCERNKWL